ncbi:ABC transporter permease subunit [Clostridium sporogenes]|uniref:ABC transporter permease subunit n=1 Tax=Clostridium sporogenes TaxID=1509 RepID=A0AAE4JTH5_CLOSG|nr:ABC transporter permease subunit [Clostridium sporogenes]MDS1004161.1 ABC transporter permease subunit [Clostridium sporogenes]
MKTSIMVNNKYRVVSIILILILWELLAYIYSPLVIPNIKFVFKALIEILSNKESLKQIIVTTKRLTIALGISITLGSILGLLIGSSKKLLIIFKPILSIMQSVPPISWLVLAIIWFGLEGKASIFIVVISTLPMMIINLIEGINNVDCKLIEMGKVFKFSKQKMIINVMIPSIVPYFQSALQIVIGLGWKIVIMGEVLSSSNGIGGEITNARLNIETNYIFAWTIIIVLLFYGTDKLILYIFNRKLKGDRYDFKNTRFE